MPLILAIDPDKRQSTQLAAVVKTQLQAELDDARDEVIYLKVKLRRNEPISRGDYNDVRDRIENIRTRARGDSAGGYTPPAGSRSESVQPPPPPPPATSRRAQNPNEIPVGTEFDVRLQTSLSSKTAQVEDRFEATTMVDLVDERGRVLVPSGSVMRGVVSSVNKATRTDRKGSLTVAFNQITVGGRNYPMRGTVTEAIESSGIKGEIGRIGAGSAVGAIIGGIIGGGKGALLGVLIGGGGTIAATEGNDVELPVGTTLRDRLDSPLALSSAR